MHTSLINSNALYIPLADKSVHCVVTSSPYWNLRDYGTAIWHGGDPDCDHKVRENPHVESSTLAGGKKTIGHQQEGYRSICKQCGAVRIDQQLGLEPTVEEYVANMVQVFREVKRVLRDDGSLWLNLGDSMFGGGRGGNQPKTSDNWKPNYGHPNWKHSILKPKDLCGVPWRVALALQSDGAASPDHMKTITRMISAITASYETREQWPEPILQEVERLETEWIDAHRGGWYLRSDIIWEKNNPLPESCTDRATRSHEYLFMLTKKPRYFFDQEAVREPVKDVTIKRLSQPNFDHQMGGPKDDKTGNRSERRTLENLKERYSKQGVWNDRYEGWKNWDKPGRNIRTVWTIPTYPYKGSHFATFPPALVEPCIKAGTSEHGVCPVCGAPWKRVVDKVFKASSSAGRKNITGQEFMQGWEGVPRGSNEVTTLGFRPTCEHDAEPVPATVLDPFAGSGTTLLVARQLGRNGIGLDLSYPYLQLARERLQLTDLNHWLNGPEEQDSDLSGLPLFT